MSVRKLEPARPPYPFEAYGHTISLLSVDDGGGYMITFPDLPGCMSDGEKLGEVLANGRDAFNCWTTAQVDMGREIPARPITTKRASRSNLYSAFSVRCMLRSRLGPRPKG